MSEEGQRQAKGSEMKTLSEMDQQAKRKVTGADDEDATGGETGQVGDRGSPAEAKGLIGKQHSGEMERRFTSLSG